MCIISEIRESIEASRQNIAEATSKLLSFEELMPTGSVAAQNSTGLDDGLGVIKAVLSVMQAHHNLLLDTEILKMHNKL